MGYDNFNFGDKLNPDEFNLKFEKLFELVKKAYDHNNQLRNRLEVLNLAFTHANTKLNNPSAPFETDANFYKLNASSGTHWEMILGGQLFTESYTLTDVTKISDSNLQFDGQAMLSHSSEISRIPLTVNSYNETVPSLGVQIIANNTLLDADKLWMILSSEAVWADWIASPDAANAANNWIEMNISVPSTLTPLVNHIKAIPIIGMSYQLAYDNAAGAFTDVAGENPSTWETEITNALITSDKFANNFRLRVKSDNVGGGSVFAFGGIEAYYKNFATSGSSIIEIDMKGASGSTRVLKDFTVDGQNSSGISIQLGDDQNFNNGTTILYNTDTEGLSNTSITRSLGVHDTIYMKLTLTKVNDTSPSISAINLNYEVQ